MEPFIFSPSRLLNNPPGLNRAVELPEYIEGHNLHYYTNHGYDFPRCVQSYITKELLAISVVPKGEIGGYQPWRNDFLAQQFRPQTINEQKNVGPQAIPLVITIQNERQETYNALVEQTGKTEWCYLISDKVENYFKRNNLSLEIFKTKLANNQQNNMQKELLVVIHDAIEIAEDNKHTRELRDFAEGTALIAIAGSNLNQKNRINLAEVALDLGKEGYHIIRGMLSACAEKPSEIVEIIKNPFKFGKEIAISATHLTLKIGNFVLLYLQDPLIAEEQIENKINNIIAQVQTMYDKGRYEKSYQMGRIIADVALDALIFKGATHGAQLVKNTIKIGEFKNILEKFGYIGEKSARLIGLNFENVSDISPKTPVGKKGNFLQIGNKNKPAIINDIKFTGHALGQMQGRGIISPMAVIDTIRNPEKILPGKSIEEVVHLKDNLKVVINKNGDVITVIWQ